MRQGNAATLVLGGCVAVAALLAFATVPAAAPRAAAGTAASHRPGTAGSAVVTIFPQIRLVSPRSAAQPSGGYNPAQIRAAYYLNPLLRSGINGTGQSIAIVDSFGSPTIRHDLAVFDRTFHLAAPPSLLIIHPAGPIPRFQQTATRTNWAWETTLDVEWAHVMAPHARIVLVETPVSENEGTSGFPQIVTAEKYVIAHKLGGVISQSFGATENTFPKGTLRPLRSAYFEAAQRWHDITVVSASGDNGSTDYKSAMASFYPYRVTSWPASDPLVTGVGGLDLNLDWRGRRVAADRVWNDPGTSPSAGGGGRSIFFARPAFQNGVEAKVAGRRGVPDVSLSASCSHPVDIYQSFAGSGWSAICGTSEATPIFAGIIALTDQVAGRPIGVINSYLYRMAAAHDPGIVDITHGNNTVVIDEQGDTVPGWDAVRGYDLASGLGTINARYFVRELAALARKSGR